MIMYKPYTYRIKCIPTNQYYYGVKYGKDADPDKFWVDYFTSSMYVKRLIEIHGILAFTHEIRKIFKNRENAIIWEQKVLTKVMHWDNYLNNHNGKSFSVESCMKGIKKQKEKWLNGDYDELRKIYQKSGRKAGFKTKELKIGFHDPKVQSLGGKNAQITLNKAGYFQSNKWRKASSRKNTTWITNGIHNKRYKNDELENFLIKNPNWHLGTTKNVVIPDNKNTIYLWALDNSKRVRVLPYSEKYYDFIDDGYYSKNGKHGNRPITYKDNKNSNLPKMSWITNDIKTSRIKYSELEIFLKENPNWRRGRTFNKRNKK